ncbi:MAG: hypothetical protein CMF12_04045 [Idiomarina sp.]|uniref:replication initiation protein n=1 Tax=Idiomarina sp. TaxID=1874361 RepID=UPI000C58684C|nr:replication initiation protein [Idiomarina sp.]MBT41675.1 hypothetical protein [Idiomarina sp.]
MSIENDNPNMELIPRAVDSLTVEKSHTDIHKLIVSSKPMTATQKKAYNAVHWALQSYARRWPSQSKFHSHFREKNIALQISRQDFLKLIDYQNTNNDKPLINAVDGLTDLKVNFDNKLSGTEREVSSTNLFMHAVMRKGVVTVVIPPSTRRVLVSDEEATTIDILKIAGRLRTKYPLSLYPFLKEYFDKIPKDEDEYTFMVDQITLRTALNVQYSDGSYAYPAPGDLNKNVVQKAVKKVNAGDFEFKVSSKLKKKQGEAFFVFRLTRAEYEEHDQIRKQFPLEMAFISDKLKSYKINAPESYLKKINSEYELRYFKYLIDIVDSELAAKKGTEKEIRNPGGYFVRVYNGNRDAFERHYGDIVHKEKESQLQAHEEEQANLKEQERIAFMSQRNEMLYTYWKEIDEVEQAAVVAAFIDKKSVLAQHAKLIRDEGIESASAAHGVIRGPWLDFLQEYFSITDEMIEDSISNSTLYATF